MKKFHQLTENQRNYAIQVALNEMRDCIKMGLIEFNKVLTDDEVVKYARRAAEGSLYRDSGEKCFLADMSEK